MNRTFLDRLSLVLVIIGAINWLMIGLFDLNFVNAIFGGSTTLTVAGQLTMFSKIIYSIVGLAGIYSATLLFRDIDTVRE